jgi:hypothetical protein
MLTGEKHFRSKAKWVYDKVLAERETRPIKQDANHKNFNTAENDANDGFIQDVGVLLRLAEGYERELRSGASFAATIPTEALLARRKIADIICELYYDPMDKEEGRKGVRFDLRGKKFQLRSSDLDFAYGGEIVVSCRGDNNNSKPTVDDEEPWLLARSWISTRRAEGVFKDDRDEGDHLDPFLRKSSIQNFL